MYIYYSLDMKCPCLPFRMVIVYVHWPDTREFVESSSPSEHFENNVSKACILMVFETILTAKKILKTTSLKHAFRRYLKWFEIAETLLKAMSLKHPFWWYLKRFWTAEIFFENSVFKACATNVFETEIWTFYFPPFFNEV